MSGQLIKKLKGKEFYAKVAKYDSDGNQLSDRRVKSVSVSGRTMTADTLDGEVDVPVVPVPGSAGQVLKSGEAGSYGWGQEYVPGDGKLFVKVGSADSVDTGFSADATRDATLELPVAADGVDGLMSGADKAEFDRISGEAFDAKAERSELTSAVATLERGIDDLSTHVGEEITRLDGAKADKTALSDAVDTINGSIGVLSGHVDEEITRLDGAKADKATTLAGYGISDASIVGTTVSIGGNTAYGIPARGNEQKEGDVLMIDANKNVMWGNDVFVTVPIDVPEPPVPELVLDGKEYQLVNINGVWWTAENLDYRFSGLTVGASGYSTSQKRANYVNNNETTYGWNGKKYGLLYNWVAVKYIEDHKAELIPGWHVPTKDEYQALVDACNPDAGTKLKSTTDWSSGNGTDLYGFNAKPAGSYTGSDFSSIGYNAYLWTSTSGSSDAYYVSLNIDSYVSVTNDDGMKGLGMAVRLVKDA